MFHVKQRIKINCFFRMLWLQILSRRQLKSFLIQQFFKNAGEVWASSPHLRSKLDFWELFFLLQLHFLKLSNSNKVGLWESRLQIQTRQRGNCSMLVGKSRGGTPFCRMFQIVFPKNNSCFVSCETLLLGKLPESGSAESFRCLPLCCSPVVALSELLMNLS